MEEREGEREQRDAARELPVMMIHTHRRGTEMKREGGVGGQKEAGLSVLLYVAYGK